MDFSNIAGSAVAGQTWKIGTLVLLAILLTGGGGAGALWWTAAAARDQALADLAVEKGVTAQLRAGVDVQNRAIVQWYEQTKAAEARGDAARQAAELSGRRYDQALQQLSGARPTTCVDAMPYVNKMLEIVR